MVQILDRPETFSSLLAKQLGGGLGKGISEGMDMVMKLRGQQQKESEKAKAKLHTMAPGYVKQMHGAYLSPDRYRPLLDKANEFVEKGFLPDEAIDLAAKSFENQRMELQGQKESGKERTIRELASMSDPSTSLVDKLKALGTGAVAGIDWLSKHGTGLIPQVEGLRRRQMEEMGVPEIAPSEYLAERMKEGKSPEEQEMIEKRISAGAVIPWGSIAGAIGKKAFGPLWKSAKAIGKETGIGTEKAAENLMKQAADEGIDVAKAVSGDAEEIAKINSLANRVSKEVPQPATQMRMGRLSPETKLYKQGEQEKILQEQLKSHPKYAAEIAADAEARNARLNKPVGPKAMGTRSVRMAMAQQELPKSVDSYRKALGRVRALEDEIAKLPAQETERMVDLLEAAKNELRDAESYAQNMLSNTKTGESWKVGFADMRQAAQNKMLDIENKIADGAEVKLALSDYNPKYAKEGKELAKKKPIPSTKTDDFYTQVHDEYAKEYRKRIQALNEEIAKPSTSVYHGMEKAKKIKERDILQKMVDSIEGENAVHRRKLGLREMEQRKLARDRLKSTTKPTEAPHIESAARPKIDMAERTRESMKTTEGRAKLAEEVIEEAAKDAPKASEKIHAEKSKLNDALDEVAKAEEKAKSGSNPRDEKSAKSWTKKKVDELLEVRDALKAKDLSVFKTKIGQDFMKSVATQAFSEIAEYFGFDVPHSSLISAVLGQRGHGYRAAFNWVFSSISKKIKKEMYKSSLENYDRENIEKYKKRFKKSVIREATKEFMTP